MVNRLLELKADVGSNATDTELGRETPREGETAQTVVNVFETSAATDAPERTWR